MHWAALLARPKYSAFAAYATAWFNFLGQIAVTASITFGEANLSASLSLSSACRRRDRVQETVLTPLSCAVATLAGEYGFESSAARIIGIDAGILVVAGLLNSVNVKLLAHLNRLSIAMHSVGVFSVGVALLASAPSLRSAKEVFGTFYDGTGDPGWSVRASPAYVALTGCVEAVPLLLDRPARAQAVDEGPARSSAAC